MIWIYSQSQEWSTPPIGGIEIYGHSPKLKQKAVDLCTLFRSYNVVNAYVITNMCSVSVFVYENHFSALNWNLVYLLFLNLLEYNIMYQIWDWVVHGFIPSKYESTKIRRFKQRKLHWFHQCFLPLWASEILNFADYSAELAHSQWQFCSPAETAKFSPRN